MFSCFPKSNHQPSSSSNCNNTKNSFQSLFSSFIFSPATVALSLIFMLSWNSGWGQYSGTGTFNKITSLTDLTDGYYVIVNSGDAFAMNNTHNGTYLANTSVSPSSNTLTNPATSIVWKIETNGTGRTIYNESTAKYVSYTGSSNNVQVVDAVSANNQRWTFSYASSVFSVANLAVTSRILQYNSSSPRFVCYTTAQQKFLLYKLAPSATAPTLTTPVVSSITTTSATLGATVSSNGGATLTARGTVWGTAASPTGNSLAEGGTSVAAFTHSRTGLTANTVFTYRGYATNSAGTGYSADGTFTTLPLAPIVGTANSVTASGFTANWSHPTMGAASYTYTVEVDDDSAFGSINSTVSSIASSNTSQAITGLAASTTYYYRVKAVNLQGSSVWSSTSAGVATSAAATPTLNPVTLSSSLTSTYGTPSTGVSFTASGSNLTSNITATAQSGYEVSTFSGSGFGASVSVASGTTVYVRFASTRAAGTYNSATAVVLSGGGASSNANVTTSSSGNTVSQKALTVTGLTAQNKVYDGLTAATATGSAALSGVVGADIVSLTGTPTFTFSSANVGTGISVTTSGYSLIGGDAANYTLTQPTLSANITVRSLTITANDVNKFAGVALTGGTGSSAFTSSGLQNGETIGSVTIAYESAGATTGDGNTVGVYASQVTPSAATGGTFTASNYSISYVAGSITVTATPTIIAIQDFETSTATPTWSYSGEGNTFSVASKFNDAKSYGVTALQSLTMDNLDISGYSDVVLSVAFAASGPDSGEDLFMDISYDNGSTWTGAGSVKLVDGFSNTSININSTNALDPTTVSSNPWPTAIGSSETQIRIQFRLGASLESGEYYYLDDIKLTGIPIPTEPLLSNSTVSSISTTSVTLGATITSDGGATVASRGTVYGTSASPTINSEAEGGTSVATFSHSRTSLTANTFYYYRGYAINSVGTGYSADGTFTTLHNAPTVGSGSNATTTTIDASWTEPTGGSAIFTYEIEVDDNSDFSSPTYTQSSISSATTTITATGLTSNTTYYFRIRANNAGGSSAWSSSSSGYTTLVALNPTLSTTSLTAFGNVCLNAASGANSFTINGSALTSADVTVASLSGFTFSTTVGGTYTSSLTLPQAGGTYAQAVYVKFTPTAVQSYDGNIVVSGGGASTNENVAATGNGISGTVNVTTTVTSAISTTGASTGGTSVSTSCGTITSKGVAYGTTANPTTPVTSDGSGTADYSSSLTGLTPNTEYNYRAYATNSNGVSSYGSNLTFTTLHNAPTVGIGTLATTTGFTANWTAPTSGGSATYTYDVGISTSLSFASTLLTQTGISSSSTSYQFSGLTEGTTYYFRVRVVNLGGNSEWSSISESVTTLINAISLNSIGTSETEDFNALANSGTSSAMPFGWFFSESGGNTTYAAGTGSANTGNTYSFGLASNSERAFGGLQTGTVTPTIGAKILNNTGFTIDNLFISYTGETWRVGAASRIDRLDFQYSLDATSLSTGTWTDFNTLDYANPGQATGSGSMLHSSTISDVITGLSISNGSTFWIRWNDFNASGSDDGMAIDDFSIKPCGTVSAPTASAQGFCSTASATVASLVATGTAIQWYSASTGGTALATGTALTTGTYYASQTLSGCESITRTSVAVTITSEPNAGTLSGTQAVCSNGSTTFISNGDAGIWSSGSTGVATINSSTGAITPISAGTSTITYTVTGTGGCSNATATRTVTVTTAPNAGTLSGTQAVCSNGSTTFTSNGDAGSWTSGSTGVATINSSTGEVTPVAAGTSTITYTVTGTGGCSNATATRTITVTDNPTAPTASPQSFCSVDSPTISDLVATGTTIHWYSASTGGLPIATSTALSTGTYYASQTVTSCESTTRTSVSVTINPNGTWIGGATGDWNDINNWCGAVPNSTSTVVVIPSDVVIDLDFPVSVLDVTIGTNSTLNAGSNSISIANGGSFTNNGTFNAGSGTVTFSGNGSISGSASTFNDLTINGTLSISTSPTVNGTVTINNSGAITTNPIIYGGSASLVYNTGTTLSTTSNEWPTSNSPRNVTLQNNTQVTLNSAKEIAGNLNLISGIINTSSTNLLTIGSNTTTLGSVEWTDGTVVGPMKRWFGSNANSTQASGIFPVGLSDQNRLAIINFTEATDGGYIVMEYVSDLPTVEDVNGDPLEDPFGLPLMYILNGERNYIQNADLTGYWDITPYNSAGVAYGALDNNSFDITLRINSDVIQNNPVTANPPGMRIIRAKGNPSAAHDPFEIGATTAQITAVAGSTAGTDFLVKSSSLQGFSWFNIGGDNETPLPIELLSFTANCDEYQIQLSWSTASENNSDYFEVLKSQDGENWRVINKQSAAGFSTTLLTYSYAEIEKSNEAYYRLNQVDINGDNKLYDPVFVDCDGETNVLTTYPNPSINSFNIALNDSKLFGEATIVIRDALGKIILEKSINIEAGVNMYPINSSELDNGVYFITIEGKNSQSKMIKHIKN